MDGVYPEIDKFDTLQPFLVSYYSQINENKRALKLAQCNDVLCNDKYVEYLVNGTNGYGRDTSMSYSTETNVLYISFLDFNIDGNNKKARLLFLNVTN